MNQNNRKNILHAVGRRKGILGRRGYIVYERPPSLSPRTSAGHLKTDRKQLDKRAVLLGYL